MDTYIDPLAGDYVYELGALKRDPTGLGVAIYLRLMTPLGSYWADATLGSRLHELQREKDVARVAVLAKQYSEQALQPIIDEGRADSITVTTERLHDGRMRLQIEVVQAGGRRLTFETPVKVS